MDEAQDPKAAAPAEDLQPYMAHPDKPEPSLKGQAGKRFRIKVTIPGRGKDLWMYRTAGEALAYQSYCSVTDNVAAALEFSEYQDGGETFLLTQEGQWLGYGSLYYCAYASTWYYRKAWKFEGNHLIAPNNSGRALAWDEQQKWPLATGKFLQVLSEKVVTVERVEV